MNINPVNFSLLNQNRLVKSKNNNYNDTPKVSFGFALSKKLTRANKSFTKALNEYVKARGTALEESAIENFLNAATNLINSVVAKLGNSRTKRDLKNEANPALLDILIKFDPARTQNPGAYFYTKLKYTLIDFKRLEGTQAGLSRREITTLKLIEELTKVDERYNEIRPTAEEVIKLAEMRYSSSSCYITSKKHVQELIDNGPTVRQRLSLDAPIKSQRGEDDGTRFIDKFNLSEEGKVKRKTGFVGNEEDKIIAQIDFDSAMQQLSPRHRRVLSLLLFEGSSQKEIAHELNVTEARVSQIKQEALEALRQNLLPSRPNSSKC